MSSTLCEWEVQKAIYFTLNSDTFFKNLAKVYDYVPQGTPYPYVTIGEFTGTNDDSLGSGTQTRSYILTLTLHIWSQASGFDEAMKIQRRIYELLHKQEATIVISSYTLIGIMYEYSTTLRDPDGLTRHLPVRYKMWVQENS